MNKISGAIGSIAVVMARNADDGKGRQEFLRVPACEANWLLNDFPSMPCDGCEVSRGVQAKPRSRELIDHDGSRIARVRPVVQVHRRRFRVDPMIRDGHTDKAECLLPDQQNGTPALACLIVDRTASFCCDRLAIEGSYAVLRCNSETARKLA